MAQISVKTMQDKPSGYICDICGKEVIYKFDFLPQENSLVWSHPSGGWGESSETETIYFCSPLCLLKALQKVYYGAEIVLSSDFVDSVREIRPTLFAPDLWESGRH